MTRHTSIVPLDTQAKARAMQHWIDHSGISNRPMPHAVRRAADARGRR